MKPFNLEEAKAGKPVQTRDGRDVKIICFDAKCSVNKILCFIKDRENGSEVLRSFANNGKYIKYYETSNDLFMKSETKEGWWLCLLAVKLARYAKQKKLLNR